jgi:hypothetical protein
MREISIYLSLKEVEDLIFNRILEISSKRLQINKAQGLFSVSIKLNEDLLIQPNSSLIILFSTIRKFEVPEKEKTLFSLHYKVPEGLITLLSSRKKVRDEFNIDSNLIDETKDNFPKKEFLYLRNGCVGVYNLTCTFHNNENVLKSVKSVLKLIFEGSSFRDSLFSELLTNAGFPTKEVQTQKFVTDRYFRAVWLLTMLKDNILNISQNNNQSKVEEAKKWMRDLLEIDDMCVLNNCLKNIPEVFLEEIDCILGYYFAVTRLDEYKSEKKSFFDSINNLDYPRKYDLLAWAIFFLSMNNDEIPYLYFSPLIQNDIYEIELNVYQLLVSKEKVEITKLLNLNRSIPREELIKYYLNIKNGLINEYPIVIQENEIESKLSSRLKKDNLRYVGLEIGTSNYFDLLDVNTCDSQKGVLNLKLNQNIEFRDITFYLSKDSKLAERLKSLKLQTKPIDKILQNKKVILGFLFLDEFSNLLNIYSELTSKISNIEKIVLVSLVDLEPIQVQSLAFDKMYREYQRRITLLFNCKCEFFIRNERNADTQEIKRNLRNSIGQYKSSQIELIDENLTIGKIRWVVEASLENWIDQEGFNYYSISTLTN